MSRWSWFEPAPKQPVPKDGLRVDRFGRTWWGEKWIVALDRLGGSYSNRLPRGRTYARSGRVVNLVIGAGEATAGVVGTRQRPYAVRIALKTFSRTQWNRIVGVVAGRARFTVALLRGELPGEVGETLEEQGIHLFPTSTKDLETSCSCPDWANPCKHVAAVHYVLAAALDMDPFLIFNLRGLDRSAFHAALAEARGMAATPPPLSAFAAPKDEMWEEPDSAAAEGFFGRGLPRPHLAFRMEPAVVDLAGLARLGPPPPALEDLPRRLKAGISKAARAALVLARGGDAGGQPGTVDDEAVREEVLALVRSIPGGATMLLLRSRLPHDKKTLHRVVRAMRVAGILTAGGKGAATRYTAAEAPDLQPAASRRRAPGRRQSQSGTARASDPLIDRIVSVLAASERPLPLKDIADRLGRKVDSRLRTAITALRADGTVTMTGHRRSARYRLTKPLPKSAHRAR